MFTTWLAKRHKNYRLVHSYQLYVKILGLMEKLPSIMMFVSNGSFVSTIFTLFTIATSGLPEQQTG